MAVSSFQRADPGLALQDTSRPVKIFIRGKDNNGTTSNICFRDIIAVLHAQPRNDSQEQEYLIIYLQDLPSTLVNGSTQGTHLTAASLQLTQLPEPLLERFLIPGIPKHLSVPGGPDGQCNIHIVVSVKSGNCGAEKFFIDVVKKTLDALGIPENQYEVRKTISEQSIVEFANQILYLRANSGIPQTVLLLSGDGGMVDLVNCLAQNDRSNNYVKPSVGLLAMGTGNALANSAGLNRDSSKGLAAFLRGDPQDLPTFTVKFSNGTEYLIDEGRSTTPLSVDEDDVPIVHGAVVCSWALHASLVADSDTTEYRKHGTQRFSMAAKELLYPSDGSYSHAYKGRLTLFKRNENGQDYPMYMERREHMYILATMVSNLEEKLAISPRSKPFDHQLRLLHWGNLPSDEVVRLLGLAFAGGEHVHEKMVDYEKVEGIRVEMEEPDAHWRRVCVDGKIIRVSQGGWFEVRRESRNVLDLVAEMESKSQ